MDDIYTNDDIFHSPSTLLSSKKQESTLKSCSSSQKEVENIYMNFGDSSVCPPVTANQTKITTNESSSSLEERKQRQWDNREADFCGLSARSCCWVVSSLTLLLIVLLIAFGMFFIHAEKKLHDLKKTYASLSENYSLANEELNQMRSNFSRLSTKHLTLQFNYSTLFDNKCPLCPYGWLIYQTSCYYISTDQMNWKDSQDDCVAKGGHLVIITNEKVQRFLNEHVNTSHAWIGLSDLKEEGKWIWVDSTTPTMRYWADRQPDDWNGEDCAHIRQRPDSIKSWNDLSCEIRIGRVCEKKQSI
ncbi:C-type lectin domain family 4 member E-like [Polypterus senegalus]|uniref:C-type lectin domain family 4 member E-like n=1 Tax=Polypterus senegalus TaxID=55291 RepID=UPI00196335A5|nr:C-type lectin domain family 4 member E-like [Polypterus senegalus]